MKITNTQNRKTVTFGGNFRLAGMNWGSAAASHATTQGSGQIGNTVQATVVSGRTISVTGYILMYGNQGIEAKRQLISAIVNPLHILKIENNGYYIEGKPKGTVEWANTYKDNNRDHAKFTFTLYCEYPYFVTASEVVTDVARWLPRFRFPLAIPVGVGITFSDRQKDMIVNCQNTGDVPIGMVMIFTAKGTVKTPSVQNIATREYIKINLEMEPGDVISINTCYGRKNEATLTRGGTIANILDYIDIESDYQMQLEVGDNLIKYDAEENVDNLSVRIKRSPAIATMPIWGAD